CLVGQFVLTLNTVFRIRKKVQSFFWNLFSATPTDAIRTLIHISESVIYFLHYAYLMLSKGPPFLHRIHLRCQITGMVIIKRQFRRGFKYSMGHIIIL